MRISVIVPVYNNEETVLNALDSVLAQTRLDLIEEIIIVNDGSTDASPAVIKEFRKQNLSAPIVEVNQANQGASAARNAGMRIARGDWIALLDADDVWLPNKLEKQVFYLDRNADIDFIGGNHKEVPLRILTRRVVSLHKASIRDLCIKWFPVTPSVLFQRRIFEEIGGFNEEMRYAEDGEFFSRICIRYNYYYIPEKIVSIGHGKQPYGESGLSANLREMYLGNVRIFQNLHDSQRINTPFYLFIRTYAYMKYLRRIIIRLLTTRE